MGGWDAYNVTEDADLGLRLAEAGHRVAWIDSSTFEEATDTPSRWIKQRSRWLKRFLQTTFVHFRRPVSWRTAVTLHLAIAAVIIGSLINPLMWVSFMAWLLLGFSGLDPVFAGAFGEACLALFICGNAAHLWLTLMAPLSRNWFGLTAAGFLAPAYWCLQSVAGYKALAGFVMSPHHWEKTEHSAGEDTGREGARA